MNEEIPLQFGKVRLKALEASNLKTMLDWRNDYRIWKWCRQNSLISYEQHIGWFNSLKDDRSIKMFGIHDTNDTFVGACGFTSIDHTSRKAEFSLYIGPQYHRKGYAQDSLVALFRHGFNQLGFNSIWGETFEGNPALRLFLDLGMVLEGIRREFYYRDGNFINCHLVGIKRNEWRA